MVQNKWSFALTFTIRLHGVKFSVRVNVISEEFKRFRPYEKTVNSDTFAQFCRLFLGNSKT
jgi:hypothetical protein